jgi:hypothetical protein
MDLTTALSLFALTAAAVWAGLWLGLWLGSKVVRWLDKGE